MAERKTVSKRDYIDLDGNVVDDITLATGARYALIGGETFDVLIGDPGKPATMYGILGAHTKLGNEANSVLNDKENPGSVGDAAAAIREFIAGTEASPPIWGVPGGGAVQRVDRDALAQAVTEHGAAIAQAKGVAWDAASRLATYRAKLDADKTFFAACRKDADIASRYAKLVGAKVVDVDSLMEI